MSRIFEALERADLERKTTPVPDYGHVAEPAVIPASEEPAPLRANVPFEAIAQHPWRPSVTSFPTLADRGAGVEQFRRLRSRMFQCRYEAPLKTVLVCSGMPSEGKSFVAANLAMSLARNNVNNILLIDADLRRPTLHSLLGAPNVVGLSEYLSGAAELKDIMQRDRIPKNIESASAGRVSNLTLIPSGKCSDNSSELVAHDRFKELIASLSLQFDWILIDSPPVLAVTDAVELSHSADGVLLVARGGHTPYDVAQRAQAAFSNVRMLGFVLNDVLEVPHRGYGYYNYYGGSEAPAQAK